MKQKRCLLIDQYPDIGGGQTIYLNLIHACLNNGIAVTALFPHGGELQRKVDEQFAGRVNALRMKELKLTRGRKTLIDVLKSAMFLLYFVRFWQLLKGHDYIYVNGPRLFPVVFFASHFIYRKYIYHLHLDHRRAEKRLIAKITRRPVTHRVIANSQFLYRQLCDFDNELAANPKLIVIENSLTPALSGLSFCNRFQNDKKFLSGTFGRVSYEKGQDLIVDLASKFPDWIFFVAGDGDLSFEHELRKRAPQNVRFIGKQKEPAEFIVKNGLTVSIVPSRVDESFGLSAIESMAASCLTIVRNRGELPNLASRTSATVFDSPADLAAILEVLQTKPNEELALMALEQFSRTRERYSFARFAEQIGEVFVE